MGDAASLRQALHRALYVTEEGLATVLWLAQNLHRPLLVEGDAGVGKTALATALAEATHSPLIRLQCFEGLDLAQAAYEWNYSRQILAIRRAETSNASNAANTTNAAASMADADLFSPEYLLARPLLRALQSDRPAVLLIDEIDRADEAFEAYLLEILADYQMTVPELGTITARHPPQVILTSNGTRELSDALRRRCLYHYLDYPDLGREIAIIKTRLPDAATQLVEQAVQFVQRLRREDLDKTPGIAETLDWIRALHNLGHRHFPDDVAKITDTLCCLLKTREDFFQLSTERLQHLAEGRKTVGVAEKHGT